MDFRLLGPLEASAGSTPLRVPAGKQRALLAILLLNANRTVVRDQIVDCPSSGSAPAARATCSRSATTSSTSCGSSD
jgi:hypothetical protein